MHLQEVLMNEREIFFCNILIVFTSIKELLIIQLYNYIDYHIKETLH